MPQPSSTQNVTAIAKLISDYKVLLSAVAALVTGIFLAGIFYKETRLEIEKYKKKIEEIESAQVSYVSRLGQIESLIQKNSVDNIKLRSVNFIINQTGFVGDKTAWLRFDPRDFGSPEIIAKHICGNDRYQLYPAVENRPTLFWTVSCVGYIK